jgi:hypothetical protein
MTIYLDLTREFNKGRLRAVICSGQAVVLHRLAIMSKDGDWILREDEEALLHVLGVLERRGAKYRFGAPLDVRWMRGGWSSHFEFRCESVRVRTDFFTRPPRVPTGDLERMWKEQERRDPPFVDARMLASMKETNRERDYAVIGELARLMSDPRDQMLHSRSARDLIELAEKHPSLASDLARQRPLLASSSRGRDVLETALDAERRAMIRANEERLAAYRAAAHGLERAWPDLSAKMDRLTLLDAHRAFVAAASPILPSVIDGHDRK